MWGFRSADYSVQPCHPSLHTTNAQAQNCDLQGIQYFQGLLSVLPNSTMKYRLLPGTLPKKPAKCKVIYRSETECTNICKHGTSGQKRKVQLPLSSKSFPTQATRLPPFTQSQSLEVSGAEVMCKTSCWRSSKKPQGPRLQRKKHKSNEMGHISVFSKSDPKNVVSLFSHEVSVHVVGMGSKWCRNGFELQCHPVSRFNNKKAPFWASHLQNTKTLFARASRRPFIVGDAHASWSSKTLTNSVPAVCPSPSLERALDWKQRALRCEISTQVLDCVLSQLML